MFAAAAAIVIAPGFAGAGYSWLDGTLPTDGGKITDDGTAAVRAVVNWEAGDTPLFNGTVAATVSGYTGSTGYTYSYDGQDNSPGSGTFQGTDNGQRGTITFTPALATGTSVTVTYTASTTTGLPPHTVTASTSTTATAP